MVTILSNIEILDAPEKIVELLHLGVSIPVLPEFKKYILRDLQEYKAKALVLKEPSKVRNYDVPVDENAGICLIYGDGSEILYFGFFGTYDHRREHIETMVEALIDYAKNNGYKSIRGPINVPTFIFGWGFMVEGSKKDVFIGCPINPPIYQEIFREKGFTTLFQEDRYNMACLIMNPYNDPKLIKLGIRGDNFEEKKKELEKRVKNGEFKGKPIPTGNYAYEYINLGAEGMTQIRDEWVALNRKFMPPSAQITPKAEHYVENLSEFVHEFGGSWMIWYIREKTTGKMVANGYLIPNVFKKDNHGRLSSVSFHAWVVHEDHRRNYIAMVMYGFTSMQGYKGEEGKNSWYISNGSWPVGAENEANRNAAIKMGGKKDRSHLIMEYNLR